MFSNVTALLWLLWIGYWIYAARGTRRTVKSESRWGRAQHLTLFVLAVLLMKQGLLPGDFFNHRILPDEDAYRWVGCGLTAFGLGWAIWARVHLGSYWSGTVTLKEGHKIIQSGPYAITRHPIYTGLFIAVFGSGMVQGEVRALIADALVLAAIFRKSSIEEDLLISEFPEEYPNYRKKVKRLIPGLL